MAAKRLILTPPERRELQRRVRSRSVRAEDSRRARVILELAGGRGLRETANYLACSSSYVQRWAGRFRAQRMAGLVALHQGAAVAAAFQRGKEQFVLGAEIAADQRSIDRKSVV